MRTILGVSALLLIAVLASGQTYNSTAASQQMVAPAMGGPVFVAPIISFPPPAGGLVLQGGYATTYGWGYPPVLITPSASFTTISANPAGATNATSNLQAGATNGTIDSVTTPLPAVSTAVEISQPGAIVPVAPVFEAAVGPGPFTGVASNFAAVRLNTVNAYGYADTRSVGEAAREAREHKTPPVRTLTNTDIQNLKNQPPTAQPHK